MQLMARKRRGSVTNRAIHKKSLRKEHVIQAVPGILHNQVGVQHSSKAVTVKHQNLGNLECASLVWIEHRALGER